MKEQKPRLPQKSGAAKAAKIFEATPKKQPSYELVKIISEISYAPEKKPESDDRAAKEVEL